MKITDIEAIVLRQPAIDATIADGSQDDLLVRIHTDEGLTGVGEVDSAPEAVRAFIEGADSHANAVSLRDMLIGSDPTRPEEVWRKLYSGSKMTGRRGALICAMGAIDVALWDIKAQALGVPSSSHIGLPSACPRRSQSAMSIPLSAWMPRPRRAK